MLREAISKVVAGIDLTETEAASAMEQIMTGQATPAQIAALLVGLRVKGETVPEITGCARAMRAQARQVTSRRQYIVDTCGTGGDGAGTFNISTAAALVVAASGVPVAKHGNRSVSSRCGSADVLEELGVRLDLEPEQVVNCLDEVGIAFFFAPLFHGAMKYAAGPRQEIGVRTVFNLLGPLTNPAGAKGQLVGVYSPELTEPLAQVLGQLGCEQALVVHGHGGLDEATLTGPTRISHFSSGEVNTYQLMPEEAGLQRASLDQLLGGDRVTNAGIIGKVLAGHHGPQRDVVLLNASLALIAAGLANSAEEGVKLAAGTVDSGRAAAKLEQLLNFTRSCAR